MRCGTSKHLQLNYAESRGSFSLLSTVIERVPIRPHQSIGINKFGVVRHVPVYPITATIHSDYSQYTYKDQLLQALLCAGVAAPHFKSEPGVAINSADDV